VKDIENKTFKVNLEHTKQKFVVALQAFSSSCLRNLVSVFNAKEDFFLDTLITIKHDFIDYKEKITYDIDFMGEGQIRLNKEANKSILEITYDHTLDLIEINTLIYLLFFRSSPNEGVLLTAQRDSIQLFYKELDRNKNILVNGLRKTKNLGLIEKYSAPFPQPIQENINFARDLTSQVIKTNSFLQKEHPELLTEIETILGVNFIVGNDSVSIKDNKTETIIPDYMASTSVRSLLYLHFWLKHQAQKGDLLMIDEPELNLHPENQIKMARLFAKLVNVGIKVWITTHSDYIVKELNNLVMLGNVSDREEMLSRFKNEKGENEYSENDILKAEDLKAYIAYNLPDGSGATVRKIDVDKYGMVESTFDETINTMNKISRTFAQHIAD
jgi:hypothetical protein